MLQTRLRTSGSKGALETIGMLVSLWFRSSHESGRKDLRTSGPGQLGSGRRVRTHHGGVRPASRPGSASVQTWSFPAGRTGRAHVRFSHQPRAGQGQHARCRIPVLLQGPTHVGGGWQRRPGHVPLGWLLLIAAAARSTAAPPLFGRIGHGAVAADPCGRRELRCIHVAGTHDVQHGLAGAIR